MGNTPDMQSKNEQARALVARMTLEEKAAFCSGRNFWRLEACERLGLPSIMMTDGPHGLRKQAGSADHAGLATSVPATCFPTAGALACSWDRELLEAVGVALGEQCAAEQVALLLGPAMNIKRHPLCGRNFEYFSEDPLLSGELAAALVAGIQSQGVGACLKHFAANNQERGRMIVDAVVDERTLREIYLRGFEIAVKKAQPWAVMCAYNRLNGVYCSEHDWLLNRVLREDWGFAGLVVTDWSAANDRVRGVAAGLDLEMPGSGGINDRRVAEAVRAGELTESDLHRNLVRNVSLSLLGAELADRDCRLDQPAHHALARRAAAASAVLLKNEDAMLPLDPQASLAVIGAFAERPRYQGAGSSRVNPTRLDCAVDAIREIAGSAAVSFAVGYDPQNSEPDSRLIAQAGDAARTARAAVVFAGLPGSYESEGFDRAHMRLPDQHNRLIQAVCQANPNTVVVLANGSPVAMPWVDAPRAILATHLAGQAGGGAIADLLFGSANPCGKLAETYPVRQADVAADRWFPGEGRQVQYREGLYVGYRYFDSAGVRPLFPFGHGLSYTTFEYRNLRLSAGHAGPGDQVLVTVEIANTGQAAGAEIVQVYVSPIDSRVYRPEQELKAFARIELAPGATRSLTMALDDSAFAIFDTEAGAWAVQAGEFEIRLGASSRDVRLKTRFTVTADGPGGKGPQAPGPELADGNLRVADSAFAAMLGKPVPAPEPAKPFHLNSSLGEISGTWPGARLKARTVAGFRQNPGTGDVDASFDRMMSAMVDDLPLRALALLAGGKPGFRALHVLVAVLNKRYLAALRLALGARLPPFDP